MFGDNKGKEDFDKTSNICFICNTSALILIIIIGALIMSIWIKDWGAILFLSLLLFFPYCFLEERCVSKYVNKSVEWIYKKMIIDRRK